MDPDEEEEAHFLRLVPLLRQLLVSTTYCEKAHDDLQRYTIFILLDIYVIVQ
jgi:hypothetical protein